MGLVTGGQTATASFPLDVPDYESPGLKLGSLIVYPQAAETASADGPYAAFTVGALRLQPRFGNVFSKADELQAVAAPDTRMATTAAASNLILVGIIIKTFR